MLTSRMATWCDSIKENMSKNIIYLAWDEINWTLVQSRVRRIQIRIYKARCSDEIKRMHWLQNHLVNSIDAKLLAVQKVTTLNRGRNTAGVDKIKSLNDKQKRALAQNLKIDGKSQTVKRVWIPKSGRVEKRPLGIPVIKDRAKQTLAKLALEPEWEANFEPNSYGFRPARRAHDAIEAIFLSLRHNSPKWIYDADIRKCFDRINQKALLKKLNTYPEMEKQIESWLKAGILEGYANNNKNLIFPTMGTPQGGVISPLLANIALHGLENHLKEYVGKLKTKPRKSSNRGKIAKQKALTLVRFADDFVIIHNNREILQLCIIEAEKWLAKMGLELNTEKSGIKDGRLGFHFLGFQIIQVVKHNKYKTKITPSKNNQKLLLSKIKEIIQNNKAISSYQLIKKLRPIIVGWGNYFKFCESTTIYKNLSHRIFQKLRAWVFRRDTRSGRKSIKEKYFPKNKTWKFGNKIHKDNWILYGKAKDRNNQIVENFLPHLSWIISEKYVKVKGNKSFYDGDDLYWVNRTNSYISFSTRIKKLLTIQNGKCGICQISFTPEDTLEVDHIIPKSKGGKDTYSNLQLLHKQCHIIKTRKEGKEQKVTIKLQEPSEMKISRSDLKTRKNVNVLL